MQVSWINPEEISTLLRQIEGPGRAANTSAWEVHTLPLAPRIEEPGEPLLGEASLPMAPGPADDMPQGDTRGGPANAEIWRIRERLRVLRDKAQTAGILSLPVTEPSPQPAPEAKPSPPEAPAVASAPVEEPPAPRGSMEPERVEESALETESPAPVPEPEAVPAAEPASTSKPEEVPTAYEPLFSASSPAVAEEAAAPEPAGLPDESEAEARVVPTKPPFVVPNLGLSDRLNEVATWASERLGTHEVLLVDDYGDVLWGAQGQTALVLSAMMAWHSSQRASATATCTDPQRIDKPLGPGRALTVLPMRTRYGVVSLAVIQGEPVAEDDAAAIREALALAVEGPTDPRSQPGD